MNSRQEHTSVNSVVSLVSSYVVISVIISNLLLQLELITKHSAFFLFRAIFSLKVFFCFFCRSLINDSKVKSKASRSDYKHVSNVKVFNGNNLRKWGPSSKGFLYMNFLRSNIYPGLNVDAKVWSIYKRQTFLQRSQINKIVVEQGLLVLKSVAMPWSGDIKISVRRGWFYCCACASKQSIVETRGIFNAVNLSES